MTTHKSVSCHECGEVKDVRAMYAVDVYWHPSDKTSDTIYVCKNMPSKMKKQYRYSWRDSCEELLTDSSWADFRFFTCDGCGRMICEQAPENGWHSQYRIVNDCAQICLRCYEEDLLENGTPREDFEAGKLPGMFFSSVDLQDWELVVDDAYIRGKDDARRVCDAAIAKIDAGYKCLVDYEHMAIGGLEGYVSLYAKLIEE